MSALALSQGQRAADLLPPERQQAYFDLAAQSSEYTITINYEDARKILFNDLEDLEIEKVYPLLTPEPFALYSDTVRIGVEEILPRRRSIVCTKDQTRPVEDFYRFASKLGVSSEMFESGHDAMLSRPQELVRLLVS